MCYKNLFAFTSDWPTINVFFLASDLKPEDLKKKKGFVGVFVFLKSLGDVF